MSIFYFWWYTPIHALLILLSLWKNNWCSLEKVHWNRCNFSKCTSISPLSGHEELSSPCLIAQKLTQWVDNAMGNSGSQHFIHAPGPGESCCQLVEESPGSAGFVHPWVMDYLIKLNGSVTLLQRLLLSVGWGGSAANKTQSLPKIQIRQFWHPEQTMGLYTFVFLH